MKIEEILINYFINIIKMRILSIEGNIGAGKSTIMKKLQERYLEDKRVIFMLEPTDMWEDIKDSNNETMLSKFYGNQEKYAFSFQIMAFSTRIKKMRKIIDSNPDAKILICERSLEADYHIFAKMLHEAGKIEDINYKVYLEFYKIFKNDFPLSGIIYINARPEVCFQRIKERCRDGEEGIPLDYLIKCDMHHTQWLNLDNKIKLLTIQTDTQCITDDEKKHYFKLWTDKIVSFIDKY